MERSFYIVCVLLPFAITGDSCNLLYVVPRINFMIITICSILVPFHHMVGMSCFNIGICTQIEELTSRSLDGIFPLPLLKCSLHQGVPIFFDDNLRHAYLILNWEIHCKHILLMS